MDYKVNIYDNENLDDLQLEGLHIIQKKDGFKFGVDAVLLSHFANVRKKDKMIDICSGTGIIPILSWGKYKPKEIVGLEIQDEMVEMAKRTAQYNNIDKFVKFYLGDLKDLNRLKELGEFDVLTVNPPYKSNNTGILNPEDKLAIARHEIKCNLEDVIVAAKVLLKDNGRIFMVHRPERLADIFTLMRKYKIEPKRVQMVHPNTKKAPNIVLVEGQKFGGKFLKWEPSIYVYNAEGGYSQQIDEIYNRK